MNQSKRFTFRLKLQNQDLLQQLQESKKKAVICDLKRHISELAFVILLSSYNLKNETK